MKKVAVLIDGGYLRVIARKFRYNPDFIELVARSCISADEELLRAFYYDCDPYAGTVTLPVSGEKKEYTAHGWMDILAAKDLFAVRRGVLKFRGFKPKSAPLNGAELSDGDFKPLFEQKGVDMRIGLDIAKYAETKAIERIILISGDTDCVPAMKYARIAGLQIVLIRFPGETLSRELMWHSDFCRDVGWPNNAELFKPDKN